MWSKLDDQFPDHPKVMQAGPLASWLYVCGTCYCNRLLTDGFIPTSQVGKLADVKNAIKLAKKLVEVGLWEEVDNGYQIHDFLDHNMSAEEAKERQEATRRARSEAGIKGMKSRWQKDDKPDNKPITKAQQKDSKNITPNPNPLRDSISDEIEGEPPTPFPGQANMPPQVQADIALFDELKHAAFDLLDKKLPKAHVEKLQGWFNKYKRALTPEIIAYGKLETAGHTDGKSLDYFTTVMARSIDEPNKGKPSTNGHGGASPPVLNLKGEKPPDGYSWVRDGAGEFMPLARDPVTDLFPTGTPDIVESKRREDAARLEYIRARSSGQRVAAAGGGGTSS